MTRPEGAPQYRLFRELEFCSNILVGVETPIMVDETAMLRIAYSGDLPLVWLMAPSDPKAERWVEVVRESRSVYPNLAVEREAKTIRIKVVDRVALEVAAVSEAKAIVSLIDFRVFGVPVFGNEKGLQIGGSALVGNTFTGSRVGFRLSLKRPALQQPGLREAAKGSA